MKESDLSNVNVVSQELLPTPRTIKERFPLTARGIETVQQGRQAVRDIMQRRDHRLLVVVGPCSIHDVDAALDYARRLKALAKRVEDTLLLVMRVYFEKPRTTTGWKGLINDPDMDDSFHIEKGLGLARKLLVDLADMGLPTATEALDPITPQYLSELISWTAIGARTTESQTHREMASGLSTPVGFKNGTDGSLEVAINALHSVSRPHHFLGINQDGQCAVIHTRGNTCGHVVLRGGGGQPNYDSVHIALCEQQLREAGLPGNIMVDCSHGNSMKDHRLQSLVLENCTNQIVEGNRSIVGVMLESNLHEGNQPVPPPERLGELKYGVSVTDACIGWDETEQVLLQARERLREVLPTRLERSP